MVIRNLTWQQVVVCVVLIVGVAGGYKLFGELPAGVLLVLSAIINLLLGRTSTVRSSDGHAGGGALGVCFLAGILFVTTQACANSSPHDGLAELTETLARCRAEGRDAGTYAAYDLCKQQNGVQDAGLMTGSVPR